MASFQGCPVNIATLKELRLPGEKTKRIYTSHIDMFDICICATGLTNLVQADRTGNLCLSQVAGAENPSDGARRRLVFRRSCFKISPVSACSMPSTKPLKANSMMFILISQGPVMVVHAETGRSTSYGQSGDQLYVERRP